MILDTTGAVLAGGASRRFGSDKALAPWNGSTLVEQGVRGLLAIFPAVLIAVKRPEEFGFLARPRVLVVRDRFENPHTLGGIYTALRAASTERVFIRGCDMPFCSAKLVEALWKTKHRFEITVPVWQGIPQPLFGFYSRACIDPIRRMIAAKSFSIQDLLKSVPTRLLSEKEVRRVEPNGASFLDIDTSDDYERARVHDAS